MITVILADLRSRFGDKVMLDPADLEPVLGVSVGQQANLRSTGKFPIRTSKIGNKVKVTIYDLAEYLSALCEQQIAPQTKSGPVLKKNRSEKKAVKGRLQQDWWLTYQPNVIALLDKAILSSLTTTDSLIQQQYLEI